MGTGIFPGDDQSRISVRELARRLGMSHEDVCRLIERHRAELERHGPLIQTPSEPREEDGALTSTNVDVSSAGLLTSRRGILRGRRIGYTGCRQGITDR
jgi:hypothetical protein